MLKRLGAPAVALVVMLSGLVWASPAGSTGIFAAAQAPSPPLGGVNIDATPGPGATAAGADREIEQARELHAKVVRIEIPWAVFEPRQQGQLSQTALAYTDQLTSDATAAGLKVIMFIDGTPCWASSAPAPVLSGCVPEAGGQAHAWPPTDPADYASFVAFLAQRYASSLAAIEIWNEPDQANQVYFDGPNKPQQYAALLRSAYTAVKLVNPNLPVLAGSLVGSNGVFLRALYAAGIKGYYDGLAVHFYTLTLAALRAMHEVQLANGDDKPMWLDEFGWTSCYPQHKIQEEQGCVTPQIQARNLSDMFRSLARTPYVSSVVSFKLQDTSGEQFGVLSYAGKRKPAFSALASVLASPFGAPSPVTLALRRHGRSVVASGSGPVGDYMQLEAFKGGLLRYHALFTLDRFDRYSITLPSVLGTRGLRVRVYQYWAGIGRAAQKRI
ncbi:MAG TPA: glycosyl hydrolase [Solirubrobacteraceae bacterium]|nr:glycosyl hydrolase [Solirubrobacteraceae bacterium]